MKPALRSISTDEEGRLWVEPQLSVAGEAVGWDLFEVGGRHLGRALLPARLHLGGLPPVVRGGKMYAVVEDEAGVHYLVRLRVERMPD